MEKDDQKKYLNTFTNITLFYYVIKQNDSELILDTANNSVQFPL